MMPYSNEYDAIPICRTHGSCVNTPNFDACVRQATILSLVARVVASCAFTPLDLLTRGLPSLGRVIFSREIVPHFSRHGAVSLCDS